MTDNTNKPESMQKARISFNDISVKPTLTEGRISYNGINAAADSRISYSNISNQSQTKKADIPKK